MKFMSWSQYDPTNTQFSEYAREVSTGKWEIINPNAVSNWSDVRKNFWNFFIKYNEKVTSIGLHDFGVNRDGMVYYYVLGRDNALMLNEDENEIVYWIRDSIRYLIDHYPNVEWFMQFIAMGESRVEPVLDNVIASNGERSQDNFIRQMSKLVDFYMERFPNRIKGIEIDFEKSSSRAREFKEPEKYRDLLKRVKDEVCIPKGLKLRINLLSMTGDYNPSWYSWTDYRTLASGRDKNGNLLCDEWQIMSYDFAAGYSAPGPSTPLWWLEDVLSHATSVFPPNDVWVGNAGYGRRWGLDAQQVGKAVTYPQIVMWQNGMYVHNHDGGNEWIWHNQSWLPFAGFNDQDSGYQITYPHLYDKFSINHAETVKGTVNRTTYGEKDIATSYFKSQQPIFTNIQGIANNPSISGNISGLYTDKGITISGEYLGEDTRFRGAYRPNKAQYQYDKNLEACVPVPDETGENGAITFNFDVKQSGNYKLIALVHFNTFTNNEIKGSLNGETFVIGGDKLKDWFPFYVDQYAWLEVGNFDFNINNTINIGISSGYIWGFVVCEDFDQNFLGGTVEFNSNLQPYYKRDSNGEPTQANMPEQMVLTGEVLRRQPRPAIIFEDTFSHMLSSEGVGYDITKIPYYMRVQDFWESGSNKVYYEAEDAYACTDSAGIQRVGFTDGSWVLQDDGTIQASVGAGYSNQLVLYKKFKANIQVTATFSVSGTYPKTGIRLLATEEGNGNEGYLALLDYGSNQVKLVYERGKGNETEIATAWMSDQLIDLKGEETTLYASILNGKAYVRVEDRTYINGVDLVDAPTSGSYGLYISGGTMKVSLFNISTLDRYEPLEKMEVEVDEAIYQFGEVQRVDAEGNSISYDEYGYLIYSGLDILETEPEDLEWSTDYENKPLAKHPSWIGNKPIRVRMTDAGIWFSLFYIGDAEGFSVAYNSDLIGFIETTKIILDYQCKGVAMWTMGQEDPLVFEYLPDS